MVTMHPGQRQFRFMALAVLAQSCPLLTNFSLMGIQREMQWGNKVKGSSVLQNISKGMSKLQKGCVSLFYSQVGRDKLSVHKMKKGTLV